MSADKEYYIEWKHSRDPEAAAKAKFQKSVEAFFDDGAVPPKRDLAKEARVKELTMRTTKLFERSSSLHNPDKTQVGIFFDAEGHEGMTQDDRQEIERLSHASNPIFYPKTYSSVSSMQEEYKEEHYKTHTKAEHGADQYVGEETSKEHNLRRTVISEYSNAIHNNTVFINPRFMSC
mmetsp:Transcript_6491/g.11367  ORF Transcript_6491/g.11367 Transcript_6491/m.11367 type:complete len:177 (-) Transcript_6491:3088-3618(-)